MIDELKILLGSSANNYSDTLLNLAIKLSLAEVEAYTKRQVDNELELIALRIAVIKLKTLDAEGLISQSFSGVSESYLNGYPEDIMMILRNKRKIKML